MVDETGTVERWAMVQNAIVINVCLWDGDTNTWQPPADVEMVVAPDYVAIGWGWDGVNWIEPVPPTPDTPVE